MSYFVFNRKNLYSFFESEFANGVVSLYRPEDFTIPLETDFSKDIVLIVKTGIGKTQYALSHFQHLVHIRDVQDYGRINKSRT